MKWEAQDFVRRHAVGKSSTDKKANRNSAEPEKVATLDEMRVDLRKMVSSLFIQEQSEPGERDSRDHKHGKSGMFNLISEH